MIHFLSKANPKSLRGTALLRLDFNAEDSWRMEAAVPTIKFLLKHSDKVVIVSHRGRPKGFDKKLSLKRDVSVLEKLLGKRVRFIPHFRFNEIKTLIQKAPRGSVFLLENIRFLNGEDADDPKLGKALASLADFYVNDSFAVEHRKNASITAVTKFLPRYAGFELEKEIDALGRAMKNPKKPLVVILGGAKVKDKLGVMKFFKEKADAFLIGGAAANTFFYLKKIPIGKSLYEKDSEDLKKIAPALGYKNLVLPPDWRESDTMILDIGKKAEKLFADKIKHARTIIWSGPMGLTEKKGFDRGTRAVAKAIAANKKAFSVVGGGETVSFLEGHRMQKKFGFISTGGSAMLVFLAGEKLAGIEALK